MPSRSTSRCVELETDKVTVEVPAPAAGVLAEIKVEKGTTVAVGALLGAIKEGAGGNAGLGRCLLRLRSRRGCRRSAGRSSRTPAATRADRDAALARRAQGAGRGRLDSADVLAPASAVRC